MVSPVSSGGIAPGFKYCKLFTLALTELPVWDTNIGIKLPTPETCWGPANWGFKRVPWSIITSTSSPLAKVYWISFWAKVSSEIFDTFPSSSTK